MMSSQRVPPFHPLTQTWRPVCHAAPGDSLKKRSGFAVVCQMNQYTSAPASSWWLLRSLAAGMAAQVFAAPPCEDKGPWPCTEEGCPAPEIGCAMLKGGCGGTFASVWSSPPAGVADDLVWVHCPATCGKCGEEAPVKLEPIPGKCISWRQTKDCKADGKRQINMDRGCDDVVKGGWSGYCECEGGIRTAESDCKHQPFTCEAKCGEQWAYLRQQRQAKVSAMGEVEPVAFDADDSLTKLYKRGKGFYVMGNTELALRHFREALKLDPEHKACKADYKQAKKLGKLLEKIEGVMGKEVEGKGRQGKMDRDEQYEEARELLSGALDLVPPGVYKAPILRDLCTCHTRLKEAEKAHDICGKHTRHDSGSHASKMLWADALVLNALYEEAIGVYTEVMEADEHSQAARKGIDQARELDSLTV